MPRADDEIVVPCPEGIEPTLERLLANGFRLDAIHPADAPRVAEVSGHGLVLRLDADATVTRGPAAPPLPPLEPRFALSRFADAPRSSGRAGMVYRDLLPERFGGHVVASHIAIATGGAVPDYVHYHEVGFQLIVCARGWVRVVYQDQGEPFRLEAGDAVLQPPTIRHRVLEASDGLEVYEVTAPASHPTRIDHERALPDGETPGRLYGGQRFVRHRKSAAGDGPVRDLGIDEATADRATARIHARPARLEGHRALTLAIVMAGSARLRRDVPLGEYDSGLVSGDLLALPAGDAAHFDEPSADFELLAVSLDASEA